MISGEEWDQVSLAVLIKRLLIRMDYRIPRRVSELMVFESHLGTSGYYLCPRCRITLPREFMAFCDRCGQRLDWSHYRSARIVYPGGQEEEEQNGLPL